MSFWASALNAHNWGWNVINGTCNGAFFSLGTGGSKQCRDLSMDMALSAATFTLGNWTVTARGSHALISSAARRASTHSM